MSTAPIQDLDTLLSRVKPDQPVLIAGPTASGKSALAIRLAKEVGGIIVNADALQVFNCWQVLSARPDADELAQAPHALYGHVDYRAAYSTGHWLRDVVPFLSGTERPIIVGGTGLNFTALTEGLAEIPAVREKVRSLAGTHAPSVLLAELAAEDPETLARIDPQNPTRVRRAWEVLRSTGKSLAQWQDETPPPLLPLAQSYPIVVDAPKEWLTPRIERRFDKMLNSGALVEVAAIEADWDPARPSAKAIGAPELIAHLRGEMTLDAARQAATIATRQYAKRQRTWFNARMKAWMRIDASCL